MSVPVNRLTYYCIAAYESYKRNSDDKINKMASKANDIPSVKGVAKSKNNAINAFTIPGNLHHIQNIIIIPITKSTHMAISSVFFSLHMQHYIFQ